MADINRMPEAMHRLLAPITAAGGTLTLPMFGLASDATRATIPGVYLAGSRVPDAASVLTQELIRVEARLLFSVSFCFGVSG